MSTEHAADRRRGRVTMEHDAAVQLEQSFTPEQRDALKTIWGLNADSIEDGKRFFRKAVNWIAVAFVGLALIDGGFGFAGLKLSDQHHSETVKIAQGQVTVRYDAAFVSCLNTNNGNRLARPLIIKTLEHPSIAAITALVNVLRPLRSSTAPPPPPLPDPIPHPWIVGCSTYATTQVTLKPPPHVPLPMPPAVTSSTTTSR